MKWTAEIAVTIIDRMANRNQNALELYYWRLLYYKLFILLTPRTLKIKDPQISHLLEGLFFC